MIVLRRLLKSWKYPEIQFGGRSLVHKPVCDARSASMTTLTAFSILYVLLGKRYRRLIILDPVLRLEFVQQYSYRPIYSFIFCFDQIHLYIYADVTFITNMKSLYF
jgi:hypothetical protein